MKKGIIVLLITVLAAGMAFATFKGSASINFGVSLDEKGWGFTNTQKIDDYSFKFALDTQSAAKGADHQTDIWAEIEAAASGEIELKKGKDAPAFNVKAEITTANIHINDITIGILGPKAAYDYASSWTLDTNSKPNHDFANSGAFKTLPGGFNVSYQGYTMSFGINNAYTAGKKGSAAGYGDLVWISDTDWGKMTTGDQGKYEKIATTTTNLAGSYYAKKVAAVADKGATTSLSVYASAETKAFELAEGMTLQAAANMILVGKDSKPVVGAAAKYAFAADKLNVGFAADFQFNAGTKIVSVDAKADAKYDIVSGTVYFGSDKLGKNGAEYIIEAKVGADIPVAENVVIKVTGEVDDLNVALKENALKDAVYTASVGTTVDKITAKASMTLGKEVDKNSTTKAKAGKGLLVAANITYATDMFTANAGVSVGFEKKANKLAYYGVKPSASISTSAMIEGCTLSFGWSKANFVADDATQIGTASKGSIDASAKISF